MSAQIIPTLLLLALPASGKSELRKALDYFGPYICRKDFGLGELIQLDDYPYVQAMLDIDKVCQEMGLDKLFFDPETKCFREPLTWLMLIELLNQDYNALINWVEEYGDDDNVLLPSYWLFERLDQALTKVGAKPIFANLEQGQLIDISEAFEDKAEAIYDALYAKCVDDLDGHTVIIEFSRGGHQGATMPLAHPFGYEHSLHQLDTEILEQASVLYVQVSVAESIRRDQERAKPPPGREHDTTLFHGLPPQVREQDYSCDDFGHLLMKGHLIEVQVDDHNNFFLEVGIFDNEDDRTSFIREEEHPWNWDRDKLDDLYDAIYSTFLRMG